jgi:Bacterial protein of unknown function (DUF922)
LALRAVEKEIAVASQLIGLNRALTWRDFRSVHRPAPRPGQSGTAALTDTFVGTSRFSVAASGGTPRFHLADSVTVTITFRAGHSWKADWVATLSQGEQDKLLKHEQGHYDLVALVGRDFFVELAALTTSFHERAHDVLTEVRRVSSRFLSKLQPLQDRYDRDTNHGQIQAQQDNWNRYISTAFTAPRFRPRIGFAPEIPGPPPAFGLHRARFDFPESEPTGPDGTVLKKPILDVLREAGIAI